MTLNLFFFEKIIGQALPEITSVAYNQHESFKNKQSSSNLNTFHIDALFILSDDYSLKSHPITDRNFLGFEFTVPEINTELYIKHNIKT